MKRPIILLVGKSPPDHGGVSAVSEMILSSPLIAKTFKLKVLRTTHNGPYEETEKNRIRLIYVFRRLRLLFKLATIVIKKKPLIVHYHTVGDLSFMSDILNLIVLKLLRRRVVFHYHTDPINPLSIFPPSRTRGFRAFLFRQTVRGVDLFILLSKHYRDYVRYLKGMPNYKIEYLYNSISRRLADKGIGAQKRCMKAQMEVLFMGRLSKQKGFDDIVSVAQRCLRAEMKVMFTIAGSANSDSDEKRIIEFLAASRFQNIQLVGQVNGEEKIELLRRADILLLPSKYEGFPISLIEAAAFGMPCIVYDIGSMREVVVDQETGIIARAGSVEDLYNGICDMYNNKAFLRKLGNNAQRRFIEKFNPCIFEEQLLGYYRRIIGVK